MGVEVEVDSFDEPIGVIGSELLQEDVHTINVRATSTGFPLGVRPHGYRAPSMFTRSV